LALHGTSQHFTRAILKFAVLKEMAAISLVKRAFRESWGLSPPSPPELSPHISIHFHHAKLAGYCPG
jgi:hypothetical protein